MKRFAFACFALALGAANASAADIAARPYAKAPSSVVSPAYSWSGFYVGVHGGGGWSRGDGFADPLPSPAAFNRAADAFALDGSGAVAGVHAGYNWQVAPTWLLGVEADWSWTDINASASAPVRSPAGVVFPGTNITRMSRDLDWLASVRGRVGWVNNALLLYITGGAAWGDVNYFGTTPSVPPFFTWASNFRRTESGYVVGAGAEWGVMPNVVLRAEYLYYRLHGASAVVDGAPPVPPIQVRYSWNDFDTHVGRIGLSYKFGGPVVAKY